MPVRTRMKPKWDGLPGRIVRGIDHSALVVADLHRAISFYRDRIELVLALAVADVAIASFAWAGPPDLELLAYREPHDGRTSRRHRTISGMRRRSEAPRPHLRATIPRVTASS